MAAASKKGKRSATYQLTSQPHRLPPPGGLCGLETGPETFQIVTNSDAQAAQLKGFVGKEISLRVDEVACAEDAGQMSEAVVSRWSVVTKHRALKDSKLSPAQAQQNARAVAATPAR